MSGWNIYWITRLDALAGLSCALSVTIGLAAMVIVLISAMNLSFMDHEDASRRWQRVALRRMLPISLSFAVASALTPSATDVAAIYVIPKIANSETANELGEEAVGLVREWINELKPKGE